MADIRLPVPGGDNGDWGDILNDFLLVIHNSDGTLKSSVLAGKADDAAVLHSANNLAELTNLPTARANLGLANVNNTADADKPVSTDQQAALDAKVSKLGDTMSGDLMFADTGASNIGTSGANGFNIQTNSTNAISIGSDGSVAVAGNMSVAGTISANLIASPVPVLIAKLYLPGGNTVVRNIPMYIDMSGVWGITDAVTSLPFLANGDLASAGFEMAVMPIPGGSNYIWLRSCTLTVSSFDGTQSISVNSSGMEVGNPTDGAFDPVVWSPTPVAQIGAQLSLAPDNSTIQTSASNVFQVQVSFWGTTIHDESTGQGN